jgi:hypothetical protein
MTDDHATEAQRKKEEAAKGLQEALARKQGGLHRAGGHDPHAQHKSGGSGPAFSPKPVRRGPRGG